MFNFLSMASVLLLVTSILVWITTGRVLDGMFFIGLAVCFFLAWIAQILIDHGEKTIYAIQDGTRLLSKRP